VLSAWSQSRGSDTCIHHTQALKKLYTLPAGSSKLEDGLQSDEGAGPSALPR